MRKKQKRTYPKKNGTPLMILMFVVFMLYSFWVMGFEKSWNFDWSKIRESIKDSVKLAEHDGLTSISCGDGHSTLKEYKRRFWIMRNASIEELKSFTKCPDNIISVIGYEGLLRNKDFVEKKELVLEAFKKESYVEYCSGCFVDYMSLGEYLMIYVLKLDGGMKVLYDPLKYGFTDQDVIEILEAYETSKKVLREAYQ